MAEHYYKKSALLRPLRSWSAVLPECLDDDSGGALGPTS
jgi:hypothetical protein